MEKKKSVKKSAQNKLSFARQTVRLLNDMDLGDVAGGNAAPESQVNGVFTCSQRCVART